MSPCYTQWRWLCSLSSTCSTRFYCWAYLWPLLRVEHFIQSLYLYYTQVCYSVLHLSYKETHVIYSLYLFHTQRSTHCQCTLSCHFTQTTLKFFIQHSALHLSYNCIHFIQSLYVFHTERTVPSHCTLSSHFTYIKINSAIQHSTYRIIEIFLLIPHSTHYIKSLNFSKVTELCQKVTELCKSQPAPRQERKAWIDWEYLKICLK